jgi:uncharacterized protein (DUF1778 family)
MPFDKKKYDEEYHRTKQRRFSMTMQHPEYDALKQAADSVGEPVNTFVKKAIKERIDRLQNESG